MFPVGVWKFYYKLMNDQLPIYFVDWKPVLPRVCTRYEIRSPAFHLPLIRHKFTENSLRYCLIKQLNREKCSILITAKVHTHSYQGYKIYLKHNAIDHYSVDCNIFECYVCQKLNSSIILVSPLLFVTYYFIYVYNLFASIDFYMLYCFCIVL